jgi:Sel1 repeat
MKRLLKWVALLVVLGVLIALAESASTPIKLLALLGGVILVVLWLKSAFVRWIKKDDKAPAWDEIPSSPPIVPEPRFKGGGPIGRAIMNWFAKRPLSNAKKGDRDSYNAVGELYDIGSKYTPKNPVEAMRWYKAAVGEGDPATASGPHYSKLRIAEMYEDGEGVAQDIDGAGRIYKTLPHYPSAMLHFAIAHIEGRGVSHDYIEAYRLLLTADKFYSMHPPTRKQVETDPQSHRSNRRHIRVRELMATLEVSLKPEQLMKAREAAREWWNAHR